MTQPHRSTASEAVFASRLDRNPSDQRRQARISASIRRLLFQEALPRENPARVAFASPGFRGADVSASRTPRCWADCLRRASCCQAELLDQDAQRSRGSGGIKYVTIGHGTKRPRKMFTDADLDAFIANQTRRRSRMSVYRPGDRHTGISTSNSEVIGFTARRNARLAVKPKK